MSAPSVSIIIPAWNADRTLGRCLSAIQGSTVPVHEIIVVDDGSTDGSADLARAFHARVFEGIGHRGPAAARNFGARMASGDILLFLDSDVCVHADTIERLIANFETDPALDGVIGSYDSEPAAPNFLSQYKNLQHCYVHQNGHRRASTFWTGCGAVRREFFLTTDGFDTDWKRPSIEDIEFGSRVIRAGARICLDPALQVSHLKRWELRNLLRTEIFDRAIPWTMLILRDGRMPDDLNTQTLQRISVSLVCLVPLLVLFSRLAAALAICLAVILNVPFYRFLARRRGLLFSLRAIPMHLLYFLYSGAGLAAGSMMYAFRRQRAHKRRVAASAP